MQSRYIAIVVMGLLHRLLRQPCLRMRQVMRRPRAHGPLILAGLAQHWS